MKRREFMAGSATAGAALRATDVPGSTLAPCINQGGSTGGSVSVTIRKT